MKIALFTIGAVSGVQRGEGSRLTIESRQPFGIRGCRCRENLDRDVAPQPGVASAIDLAHSACANRLNNLVGRELVTRAQHQWAAE